MDPLNTLWLAPVGSAMVAAVSVPGGSGETGVAEMMEVRGGWVAPEASARRGDGSYLSPGGRTVCFAAELDC